MSDDFDEDEEPLATMTRPALGPSAQMLETALNGGIEGQEAAISQQLEEEQRILAEDRRVLWPLLPNADVPEELKEREAQLFEISRTLRPWMLRFVASMRLNGIVTIAAHDANISPSSAYRYREKTPAFATCWDEAVVFSKALMEARARHLALEGVDEPIYQQGVCVGHKRVFSERLITRFLEADQPERFNRDRKMQVELSAGSAKTRSAKELTATVQHLLPTLSDKLALAKRAEARLVR